MFKFKEGDSVTVEFHRTNKVYETWPAVVVDIVSDGYNVIHAADVEYLKDNYLHGLVNRYFCYENELEPR